MNVKAPNQTTLTSASRPGIEPYTAADASPRPLRRPQGRHHRPARTPSQTVYLTLSRPTTARPVQSQMGLLDNGLASSVCLFKHYVRLLPSSSWPFSISS